MTGDGTSISPYIVTTWEELVQAASQPNKHIEFLKEPGTINIEEEYGKNEPPELNIATGANINGNGWKIQGLWGKSHNCINLSGASSFSDYIYMKNLNFDSFHSQSDYFLSSSNGQVLLTSDCVFKGTCEKNFMSLYSIYSTIDRNPYLKNSSLTIDFTSLGKPCLFDVNNNSTGSKPVVWDCAMKLRSIGELTLFNFRTNSKYTTDIQSCRFDLTADNCKIFNTSSTGTIVSGCVFTGNSQSAIDIGNGTPQTRNFFDEEAFPNAIESLKFEGVPHANIGDSAYLSQRGLSIGVSDDYVYGVSMG